MTTDSNNSTSNSSYEIMTRLPASDCIPWLVVGITECLAIVILNIITIIVFVKQRQLQRRSTYLVIHLAVVDLLVGAVSGPVSIEEELGTYCDLWTLNFNAYYLQYPLRYLWPVTSLGNLAVIALERGHATFRPFKHRFVKKRVYRVIISAMWLTSASMVSVQIVFYDMRGLNFFLGISVKDSITMSYLSICLFSIYLSYVSIYIKVRCCSHPRHHGAVNRERKLTCTLLLVTIASLLSWLPFTIFLSMSYVHNQAISNLSLWSYFHIRMALLTLLTGNSLVNPIVYASRMSEFRAGIKQIFRRVPNQSIQADLPLENLER